VPTFNLIVSESIEQMRRPVWGPKKNVTDSSLDSMQIDENRYQKLRKKLFPMTAAIY